MGRISVGAAIGSGFGLIARRPLSVVALSLPPLLVQIGAIALLAPLYIDMFSQLASAGNAGGAATPTMSPALMQMQGMVQLLNFAQLFIAALTYCAVFRAVLHPEKSSFASLRVGVQEFYVGALLIGATMALGVGIVVLMIPIGIIIAIVAVAVHGVAGGVTVAILAIVAALAILVALLVIGLRFAFVGPMIIEDGKFHLFESWTMTRGRVGSLFMIALGIVGVFLLVDIVVILLLVALGAGAVANLGGLSQAGALFQQSPQAALTRILPFLAIYGVVMVPISGCVLAIGAAPWARAYKDLLPAAADAFA
jgi:hypothetical protein